MAKSEPLTVRFPKEIRDAIDAFCKANGEKLSPLIIRAVCNEIGRPELVKAVRPPNRPKGAKSNDPTT